MRRFSFLLLALASFSFFVPSVSYAQDMKDKTIVEIAAGNSDFETLVAAVKAAGLAETLMGDGPFTVFAPTDAAFDALPAGLVGELVKPANKAVLTKILTYHVVAGNMMAKDVVSAITSGKGTAKPSTVEGSTFSVMAQMDKVMIKDGQGNVANVVSTDIAGSNGVIHVIDKVLLPANLDVASLLGSAKPAKAMMSSPAPEGPSIAAVASGNGNFKTLVAALSAVNLVETFDSPGEYTVFAPTDAAFDKLPDGTVDNLVTKQKETLKKVLAYHVIPAKITSTKLVEAIKANKNYYMMQTLGGETLVATINSGNVEIIDGNGNRSTVVITDVDASNGVIHAVDSVIMPRM
jgi:uncharacterized surface protein with fasciclin (FAS1) repeats